MSLFEHASSIFQCIEHRVCGVPVKLDVDLRPRNVGQVVELMPGGDRHQGSLDLIVDGLFGDLCGAG